MSILALALYFAAACLNRFRWLTCADVDQKPLLFKSGLLAFLRLLRTDYNLIRIHDWEEPRYSDCQNPSFFPKTKFINWSVTYLFNNIYQLLRKWRLRQVLNLTLITATALASAAIVAVQIHSKLSVSCSCGAASRIIAVFCHNWLRCHAQMLTPVDRNPT